MKDVDAIILAAGKGKRMKSDLPKPLHQLSGKTILNHVVDNATGAGIDAPVVLISRQIDRILEKRKDCQYLVLPDHLGTGHSPRYAKKLCNNQYVMVLNGDGPFYFSHLIKGVYNTHKENNTTVTFLTKLAPCQDYGVVHRDQKGRISCLLEKSKHNNKPDEICELNLGVYMFDADWFWGNLYEIKLNEKGEYYLTDLVEMAYKQAKTINTFYTEEAIDGFSINSPEQLAEAEELFKNFNA